MAILATRFKLKGNSVNVALAPLFFGFVLGGIFDFV